MRIPSIPSIPQIPSIYLGTKEEKPQPPVVVNSPFTLVAGDSGDWFGYSSGDIPYPPFNPPVGSISNQPRTDGTLEACYQSNEDMSLMMAFHGITKDAFVVTKAMVNNQTLFINNIYIFAGFVWLEFMGEWDGFVDRGQYNIQLHN